MKVLSVLYYIGAGVSLLFALLFLIGAGFFGAFATQLSFIGPLMGALGAAFFIFVAVLFLAMGVLGFFVGRGLWKVRAWARVVAIIFACLGTFFALLSLIGGSFFSSLVSLAINGFIGWYLLFNKEVKSAFA